MKDLITTVGIEYTYLHKSGKYWNLTRNIRRESSKLYRCYNDGCVEIPSSVHRTWNDMKNFYNLIQTVAKKYKLKTHLPYIMSGGGHVHLGLQQWDKKFRRQFLFNIMSDFYNRPYLNWIFNEPEDDWNANHITQAGSYHFENYRNINSLLRRKGVFDWNGGSGEIYLGKGHGLNYCVEYKTIEFRIFDAPSSWKQVVDHVDFCNAYYKYILRQTKKNKKIKLKLTNPLQLKQFNYNRSRKEFYTLLRKIGLSPKRYSKYVTGNLKERYKLQTLY